MTKILVCGGAGFIGSHFVRHMLSKYPDYQLTVLDKLTYAGNLDNLQDMIANPRFRFAQGDISDSKVVEGLTQETDIVVNFAAETHVDRSLLNPGSFIMTDIYGTYVLMEAARRHGVQLFVQIGTDEVYGSILEGSFSESDPLHPSSPYAASKAGADMLVLAYHTSYDLPIIITRSSNNFGPFQYPEKYIPLMITNALDNLLLPIYGDGKQVRDWIYVLDNCEAIDLVIHKGQAGQIYNIAGGSERHNLEIVESILGLLGKPKTLLQHVTDRPGHDRRYSLDSSKARALGWHPNHSLETALASTVKWYQDNQWWWRKIKSSEFSDYYRQNYAVRLGIRGDRGE